MDHTDHFGWGNIFLGNMYLEKKMLYMLLNAELWLFLQKKACAEKCYILACFARRDLSYETDSGPKTKTDSRCVSGVMCIVYCILVTEKVIIKFAAVTDYKIYFGASRPICFRKPSCEVDFLICVRGYFRIGFLGLYPWLWIPAL